MIRPPQPSTSRRRPAPPTRLAVLAPAATAATAALTLAAASMSAVPGAEATTATAAATGSTATAATASTTAAATGTAAAAATASTTTAATASTTTAATGPRTGPARPAAQPGTPARYCVGAAKVDITPTAAMIASGTFYLGGYGIGPVHPAHGVLRPLYARSIAIGVPVHGTCPPGGPNQVVITADDLQGHFLAYQQGPYGFANVEAHIAKTLQIPASHDLVQSTHTHNGPDDLGVWGGVPTSYLAEVASGTETAITEAVSGERLATVEWATADMAGFTKTFGPDTGAPGGGDSADYPTDTTLRVLQARAVSTGRVISTLVDFSCHATVYGPLDEVSPDWPGATATYLEGDQVGDPGTGYPGSVAVVTVGAVGHTWPNTVPAGDAAPNAPASAGDDNAPADHFGDAVGHMAMAALAAPAQRHPLTGPARVDGVSSSLTVVNDNPLLLAAVLAPVPGLHAYRADTPPYQIGDALVTEAQLLRVGDLAFMGAPGEPYPSIERTLSKEIAAAGLWPLGLANDQLGYIEQLDDYNGALQCSSTDEGFFTLSPTFGDQLEAAERAEAATLGFAVHDPGPLADLHTGTLPPPTACATQQLQQPGSTLP